MIYYIYKIYCKDTNISHCYIGSTKNIKKRIWEHKHCCNNKNNKEYNYYKNQIIRDNGNWDNWTYEILEEIECENKKQVLDKEQEYIYNIKPSLNRFNASGLNIENKKIKNKERYEQNKEQIIKKQIEYQKKRKILKNNSTDNI